MKWPNCYKANCLTKYRMNMSKIKRKYTWNQIKQSSKDKDGILALYIYRKFAFVLTYILANFVDVSANHVTTLAMLTWLSAAVMIWFNYHILAAVLIFLGFVLDCTDGNIARLKKQVSDKGRLYDTMVDRISFSLILLVLAIKISIMYSTYYIIVLSSLLLVLMIFFDIVRRHIEKLKGSDIHDTALISSFESKIKARLKKIMPFINWNNVIIGIGADLEWTLLIVASVFSTIFIFLIMFLIILIVSGIFAIIAARKRELLL